ncbi:MAG: hypothetical protein NTZ98_02580 [Acidobacteria bacterium]|nr:hypothetical protein [Acidobacteriota bacterium]
MSTSIETLPIRPNSADQPRGSLLGGPRKHIAARHDRSAKRVCNVILLYKAPFTVRSVIPQISDCLNSPPSDLIVEALAKQIVVLTDSARALPSEGSSPTQLLQVLFQNRTGKNHRRDLVPSLKQVSRL